MNLTIREKDYFNPDFKLLEKRDSENQGWGKRILKYYFYSNYLIFKYYLGLRDLNLLIFIRLICLIFISKGETNLICLLFANFYK